MNNYDVMISHMPCGALMANKLLKKNKIKYVCAVHASDIVVLKNLKYLIFRKSLKKAYLNADKIAARSPVLQAKIEEILPDIQDKTFVAYSGIEEKLISRNEKTFNQEELQISTVASLIKRKNINIILDALSIIPYKFHLNIIGDGKEKKHLEKKSRKLGLSEKVTFCGKIERQDVIKKLVQSDIFILLSNNETFGLCYLEAMATGNIVIAKKNDGIDGILQNEQNAFLIKADKYELKQCLEKIFALKNTEIENIKRHSMETIENLTSSKAADNYLKNII